MATTARLMTIDDLRERWGLDPTSGLVLEHVRAGRLKFVDLSARGITRSNPGEKTVRFRQSDVEAFEAAQTRVFEAADVPAPIEAKAQAPAVALAGWDGKTRGRGAKR